MGAKYKIGDKVNLTGKGRISSNYETVTDVTPVSFQNQVISDVVYSTAHKSYMYRCTDYPNWTTEDGIELIEFIPEYVKLIHRWSAEGEYMGEIFELSTLNNLSKFRYGPSKETFRGEINKWIKDGNFEKVSKKEFLIQEARRIYPVGTIYKNAIDGRREFTVPSNAYYSPCTNDIIGIPDNGYLYHNGNWAVKIEGVYKDGESLQHSVGLNGKGISSNKDCEMWDGRDIPLKLPTNVLEQLKNFNPNHIETYVDDTQSVKTELKSTSKTKYL